MASRTTATASVHRVEGGQEGQSRPGPAAPPSPPRALQSMGSEVLVINERAMPFEPDDDAWSDHEVAPDPRLSAMSDSDAPEPRRTDRATEAAPSTAHPADGADPGAAALRDAEAIAARVAADERAADEERERLAREPLPVVAARAEQVFQPWPDEIIHAERHAAMVERGQDTPLSGGTLYLTSRRLVHVGREAVVEIDLERIADMAVALERLLLIELTDGSDLAIEVDGPRLLRVQVAAARAVLRERTP